MCSMYLLPTVCKLSVKLLCILPEVKSLKKLKLYCRANVSFKKHLELHVKKNIVHCKCYTDLRCRFSCTKEKVKWFGLRT